MQNRTFSKNSSTLKDQSIVKTQSECYNFCTEWKIHWWKIRKSTFSSKKNFGNFFGAIFKGNVFGRFWDFSPSVVIQLLILCIVCRGLVMCTAGVDLFQGGQLALFPRKMSEIAIRTHAGWLLFRSYIALTDLFRGKCVTHNYV